eukprot:TRINITY_DN37778_c0_g1_i1.p1 TRINITY_DN37778_c0_g1~~TRINITY_DN37778_c0_g1_i1.p1  ORF type:complete len:338 (+),score=36.32 TRINITY_DN37778_c0_g1_i1:133-1146(+)
MVLGAVTNIQSSCGLATPIKFSNPLPFPKPVPRKLKITCRKMKAASLEAGKSVPKGTSRSLSLKQRLAAGEKLYGMFMMGFSPVIAEIAGYAGYDYVVVDMEHGPGGNMSALTVLQALASTGTPAVLRIPENSPVAAKKALDLGPQGIMIPLVDSPKSARKAVSYCKYPPRGVRGVAYSAVRASKYGLDNRDLATYEDDLLIMCQVESVEAVDKVEDIAAVEGVDCIQMGPTDLAADMGFLNDLTNDKVMEMRMRAEKTVLKKGDAFLAGFAMPGDPPLQILSRGYHMIAGAVDVMLIRDAMVADLERHKFSRLGISETSGDKESHNSQIALESQTA